MSHLPSPISHLPSPIQHHQATHRASHDYGNGSRCSAWVLQCCSASLPVAVGVVLVEPHNVLPLGVRSVRVLDSRAPLDELLRTDGAITAAVRICEGPLDVGLAVVEHVPGRALQCAVEGFKLNLVEPGSRNGAWVHDM